MREILFRGKRTDNGEWVYGCLIQAENYCCILEDEDKVHPLDFPYLDGDLGVIDGYATPIFPETVGQYTGLTDKNGKKIFEGDIIEGNCHSQWSSRLQRCVVEYGRDGFEARHYVKQGGVERYYAYKVLFSKDVIVIGTIHDNPELLEGK